MIAIRMRYPGILLILLGSCSAPRVFEPGKSDEIARLFEALEKGGRFNGTVLVAEQGIVRYRRAHGFKNLEQGERLDAETAFEVGSISKTLTAVAVHQLVERGRLSLDDPLPRFFPKLPYDTVTIRGLLSHTSGLFDVYGDVDLRKRFYAFYDKPVPPYTNKDYLAFLEAFTPPVIGGAAEKDHYSNTAYVLLALIVEQVSGAPFDAFLQENILGPAGMSRTFVLSLLRGRRVANLATGYQADASGSSKAVVSPPDPPRVHGLTYGDDEIATTVDDLHAFDRALRSGRLLRQETLRHVLIPPMLKNGKPAAYALGFAVRHENGVRTVSHGGSTAGFLAYGQFSAPDNETTVFILTNVPGDSRAFRETSQAVQRILHPPLTEK